LLSQWVEEICKKIESGPPNEAISAALSFIREGIDPSRFREIEDRLAVAASGVCYERHRKDAGGKVVDDVLASRILATIRLVELLYALELRDSSFDHGAAAKRIVLGLTRS
jgi:hypothetical protein